MRALFSIFLILTACSNNNEQTHSKKSPQENSSLKILPSIVSQEFNPDTVQIKLLWRNENNEQLKTIGNTKNFIEQQKLNPLLIMNAGMYLQDYTAQGLFVQDGKIIAPINTTQNAYGNFYMQPNGIFAIAKSGKAIVSTTQNFTLDSTIQQATQSGPMLVIVRKINSKFSNNGTSFYIRNGVGILPNGNIICAISTKPVNFYTFAKYFADAGCVNALYLDGFVSRMWCPQIGVQQLDGDLGTIMAVVRKF
jgi:uncharacterized protein YigE (DUF2233 family)